MVDLKRKRTTNKGVYFFVELGECWKSCIYLKCLLIISKHLYQQQLRYFKRKWNETRGDQYDNWGTSIFFIETDNSGFPSRQIEKYDNGIVLKYGDKKTEDEFGMLGDQDLDIKEFGEFEISKTEFETEWESN